MIQDDGFNVGTYTGYISSGCPSILVPQDYYKQLLYRILPSPTNFQVDAAGFSLVPCIFKDSAPKLKVLLGGYWVEILPQHYLSVVSGDTCRLELNKNTVD